jgi:ABC-2 type transport system permease protein
VLGKWLAAWAFCVLALALTFPLWITVNLLAGRITAQVLTGYLAARWWRVPTSRWASAISALTRNQVIALSSPSAGCFFFAACRLRPSSSDFLGVRLPLLDEAARGLSARRAYRRASCAA